jgi:hypothetical protein
MQLHHITQIDSSRAGLQTNLDIDQIAIENDYGRNFSYKDGAGVYHTTANQFEDASFSNIHASTIVLDNGGLYPSGQDDGAIIYSDNGTFTGDTTNLYFDPTSKYIRLGGDLHFVNGKDGKTHVIKTENSTDSTGGSLLVMAGSSTMTGEGTSGGGHLHLAAGNSQYGEKGNVYVDSSSTTDLIVEPRAQFFTGIISQPYVETSVIHASNGGLSIDDENSNTQLKTKDGTNQGVRIDSTVSALNARGLSLCDDGGNRGIHIKDGGDTSVNDMYGIGSNYYFPTLGVGRKYQSEYGTLTVDGGLMVRNAPGITGGVSVGVGTGSGEYGFMVWSTDHIAIATSATSGETVRIDNTGHVGINRNAASDTALDVAGLTRLDRLIATDTTFNNNINFTETSQGSDGTVRGIIAADWGNAVPELTFAVGKGMGDTGEYSTEMAIYDGTVQIKNTIETTHIEGYGLVVEGTGGSTIDIKSATKIGGAEALKYWSFAKAISATDYTNCSTAFTIDVVLANVRATSCVFAKSGGSAYGQGAAGTTSFWGGQVTFLNSSSAYVYWSSSAVPRPATNDAISLWIAEAF